MAGNLAIETGSAPVGEPLDLASSRAARQQHNEMVAWTNKQFKIIKNGRIATERQWYINLAFFFGRQYVQLKQPQTVSGAVTTKLWTPPAPYYRSRPVINRVRKTIRQEISQLTSNKPNAYITPASAEDRDLYAAQAGEQIWDNLYNEKKLKLTIRRAVWWNQVCGNGFLKTWWNPDIGPDDERYKAGKQAGFKPEDMAKSGVMPKMGDVDFCPETPFHIFCPDLREEELENQPFLIHAQSRSSDWVKMRFKEGKALDGTPITATNAEAQSILEESFLNMIGTKPMDNQDNCLILEVWVKPGVIPLFPEGAQFTQIGDKIVQGQQGWPYSHGKFPFAKFDHIPGGKFYSTSSIEDLVPLQKEYNRTRGQIIEAKNRMSKPQLTAARGSIDASKITSEPGLVIEYTPGFEAPKPIPLSPLPNYVLEELDRILTDWNDIAGQHEVSQGQTPPGVTAATAISYLQERDESIMSMTFDSTEEALEKTAHMALSLVRDYWDLPRTIKVTGQDGSFDALTFKGSDLGSNIDIKIEGGSSLPQSKAARQAFVMDLMTRGFIDPQQGLEVMDMGGINKIYERLQVDKKQAQRENLRMSKVTPDIVMQYNQNNQQILAQDPNHFGTTSEPDPMTGMDQEIPLQPPLIVPVNTWDNHKIHVVEHNNFRKGQAFESLPDEIKTIFEAHVQAHLAAIGVEMMSQNPEIAAGLPPGSIPPPPGGEEGGGSSGGESQPPGPMPSPDASSGLGGQE